VRDSGTLKWLRSRASRQSRSRRGPRRVRVGLRQTTVAVGTSLHFPAGPWNASRHGSWTTTARFKSSVTRWRTSRRQELVLDAFERRRRQTRGAAEVRLTKAGRTYGASRRPSRPTHATLSHSHQEPGPHPPQTWAGGDASGKAGGTIPPLARTVLPRTRLTAAAGWASSSRLHCLRPTRGIDGLVPADRVFRAAPHVRGRGRGRCRNHARQLSALRSRPSPSPWRVAGRAARAKSPQTAGGCACIWETSNPPPPPHPSKPFTLPEQTNESHRASTESTPTSRR